MHYIVSAGITSLLISQLNVVCGAPMQKINECNRPLSFLSRSASNPPSRACSSSSSSSRRSETEILNSGIEWSNADDMLFEAMIANNMAGVSNAIELHGANINLQDSDGVTGLMLAIVQNKLELAKKLLGFGADPNLPDNYGRTPLHYAARPHRIEFVKLLLQQPSINLNLEDYLNYTPLSMAITDVGPAPPNEHINKRKDLVLLLLCNGAKKQTIKEYVREGKHSIRPEIIQLLIKPELTDNDCMHHVIPRDL